MPSMVTVGRPCLVPAGVVAGAIKDRQTGRMIDTDVRDGRQDHSVRQTGWSEKILELLKIAKMMISGGRDEYIKEAVVGLHIHNMNTFGNLARMSSEGSTHVHREDFVWSVSMLSLSTVDVFKIAQKSRNPRGTTGNFKE
jgi:hypothetical protein